MSVADVEPDEAVDRFRQACADAGYDEVRCAQLITAAQRLPLPLATATTWLEGGFTPWAAVAWRQHEFDTPAEAAMYRAMGLGAEAAFWERFDRRHRAV